MGINVVHQPEHDRYALLDEQGERIGKIDYRESDGVITMWHTEVDPDQGGKGYGSVLVKGALDDARARGLLVKPTCPFIAAYIERHAAYGDLLAGGKGRPHGATEEES